MTVIDPRQEKPGNLIWFTSGGIAYTGGPGDNDDVAMQTLGLSILVPFRHKVVKAFVASNNVVSTGTLQVTLVSWIHDAATASPTDVSDDTEITVAGTATDITIDELTFTTGDNDIRLNNTLYSITLTGTDAADRFEDPCLTIGVEPVPRSVA